MRLTLSALILIFMVSCAQVVPLTGGEKDIYAPTIDSSKTYPLSGTTNYLGDEIKIKFNEYIKLKNPSENIIITPQLKEKPTLSVKNKVFKLKFNEKLEDNTTYVINFNGAIQDITEQNDSVFQYVFSTGNYIDSLSIKGQVNDAYTNQPLEKVLIAVYPKQSCDSVNFDSIPYKVKPTYLSQTNKQGKYIVNYLKPNAYYVFAIEDKNRNLLLDADDEKIGFISSAIDLTRPKDSVNFRLFEIKSTQTKVTSTSFDYPGKLTVVLSNEPEKFKLWSDVDLLLYDTKQSDSLIYWTKKSPSKSLAFYYKLNQEPIDTIKPIYHQPKKSPKRLKVSFNLKNGMLQPNENLIISVNEPLKNIDSTKIHFFDVDSNAVEVKYHIKNLMDIEFDTDSSTASYFTIDSLALESIYGHFSKQNLIKNVKNYVAEDYYGTINLTIDSLVDKNSHYIIELLDSKNKVIRTVFLDANQNTITIKNLPPGTYHLRMIKDDNQDKKWTAGSLLKNQQAEKVYYLTEQIKLRSKWSNDIVWQIKP